ncbi:hypothetical protein HWV62_25396 [Athelia sp. TMB]|nr:hypothetical protein HWV62_25396 [Athelia sp. TMB]
MTSALTQQWLRQSVQSYAHKDRVYADIDAALARFQTLRPKSDVYTYDDGRTQLLLCVHGLLPISFRHASYNIPIAIWVTRDHPRAPPIPYVVPTADMLIKAGPHVDHSGRCAIEYVHHWARKSEVRSPAASAPSPLIPPDQACSLSGLLEAMQAQFSREPPVYAKPKNAPARPPPTQIASPGPTPIASDRPLLPPKPGSSVPQRLSSAAPTSPGPHANPLPHATSSLATRPPPPLPPHDPRPPQYIASPTSASAAAPSQAWIPAGHNLPVYQPPTDISPPPTHFAPPPPPPPPPQPAWTPTQPHQPPPNLLDEEDAAQSAPAPAPAPPRPPNPELQRLHAAVHAAFFAELASLSSALAPDAARLRAQQADLLAGAPAIEDEAARLRAVRDVCRGVAGRLRGAVGEGARGVGALRRQGDPAVDELVCAPTIVHNQLIDLVAEDNAIEDTIYHLHRALSSGRVDLDRFLRTTRVLAEEQFMKRALIEKIQAGVPMGTRTSRGASWA